MGREGGEIKLCFYVCSKAEQGHDWLMGTAGGGRLGWGSQT